MATQNPNDMQKFADSLLKTDPNHLKLYDQMFLNILQKEGKIELFLDSVFSFLYRKTDFFRFATKENPKIGFRPGDANRLVEGYFTRYMMMSIQAYEESLKKQSAAKVEEIVDAHDQQEETSISVEESASSSTSVEAQKQSSATKNSEKFIAKSVSKSKTSDSSKSDFQKLPKAIPANPEDNDTTNGGKTDLYSWNQTYDEVEINIPTPATIKKANQIRVDFKQSPQSRMLVKFDNQNYCDLELAGPIVKDDCTWSFEKSNSNLVVTLAKNSSLWWNRVAVSDEKIDMKQVNPVRPMADMSVEEQAVINKLRYDQQQKMLGKATSEQEKALESLRKGWNAEGSPFKGQEFDPSKFNLDSIK